MATYDIKDELNILNPKKIRIYKDEFNVLKLETLEDDGSKKCLTIEVVMGFPLTNPSQFISLVEMKNGKKDKEIGMIEDLKEIDSKSRKALNVELKRIYFMPQITKINRMNENHGVMKFNVETDKGQREFETRYREDIRKMSNSRIIIRDSDGNRYEIKDYQKLDQKSINMIDSEV